MKQPVLQVCQQADMCPAHVNSRERAVAPVTCNSCKQVIDGMKAMLKKHSDADMLSFLHAVCHDQLLPAELQAQVSQNFVDVLSCSVRPVLPSMASSLSPPLSSHPHHWYASHLVCAKYHALLP